MSDDAPPPPATPPGWYPEGVNGLRYWDGKTWTQHRAPDPGVRLPSPKRTRNYIGDISLVIAIIGILAPFVLRLNGGTGISLALLVFAVLLSITALSRARASKSKATAIVALCLASGILLIGFLLNLGGPY